MLPENPKNINFIKSTDDFIKDVVRMFYEIT